MNVINEQEVQARSLALSLDCFTESELQALASAKQSTVEAWRKRGKGPAYVLFGNRFLYPRKAVADYLQSKIRERLPTTAKGLL